MSTLTSRLWPIAALLVLVGVLVVTLRRPPAPPPSASVDATPTPPPPAPPSASAPTPADLPRALGTPDPRTRAQEFGTTFLALLAREPELALAHVRTLPPGPERTPALIATLDALARSAPERALTLAREHLNPDQ